MELNGLKYSRERFEDYKFRAIAEFEKDEQLYRLDIYTTDDSKANIGKVLKEQAKEGIEYLGLIHWCSRETDDLADEMINEWIDEM